MEGNGSRKLDVVLLSASNLKKVNKGKMHAYAVAWIEPSVRVQGPIDKSHGSNPEWNATITVTLEARTQGQKLNIELLGHGVLSTKPIGSVLVDLTKLLQDGASGAAAKASFTESPVILPSGVPQGSLNFELHLHKSQSLLAKGVKDSTSLPQS